MQNKNIFYIIIANVLWSLIPVLVIGLFNEFSILTIIFLRFFISGISLLTVAIILILVNNRNTSNEYISLKSLFKFTFSKNESFFKMRYIFYFAIMGFFGIILQIIFFFLALKTTTISLTMIGFQLAIVFIAIYEHGAQSERLDFFKILYIVILIFVIGIIISVSIQGVPNKITLTGIIYIILFTLAMTFFQITIDRDSYSKDEIKIMNKNENYKMPRMLIKISLVFLTGVLLMFPFIIILNIIPIKTDLTPEIGQFFDDLFRFDIIFRWEIAFLILGATIAPFVLIFIANAKWSPFNLTYRQWNSILNIIEPIGGIFFGVLFGFDSFPVILLSAVLFLLIISILLRYIHESTNKVIAYLLINKEKGFLKGLSLKLLKFNGIYSVHSLIGTYDIIAYVRTNSFREFSCLVNEKIRNLEEIKNIKILFINKINKITI